MVKQGKSGSSTSGRKVTSSSKNKTKSGKKTVATVTAKATDSLLAIQDEVEKLYGENILVMKMDDGGIVVMDTMGTMTSEAEAIADRISKLTGTPYTKGRLDGEYHFHDIQTSDAPVEVTVTPKETVVKTPDTTVEIPTKPEKKPTKPKTKPATTSKKKPGRPKKETQMLSVTVKGKQYEFHPKITYGEILDKKVPVEVKDAMAKRRGYSRTPSGGVSIKSKHAKPAEKKKPGRKAKDRTPITVTHNGKEYSADAKISLKKIRELKIPAEAKAKIATKRGYSRFDFGKGTGGAKVSTKTQEKTTIAGVSVRKGITLGEIRKLNVSKEKKEQIARERGYKRFNFDKKKKPKTSTGKKGRPMKESRQAMKITHGSKVYEVPARASLKQIKALKMPKEVKYAAARRRGFTKVEHLLKSKKKKSSGTKKKGGRPAKETRQPFVVKHGGKTYKVPARISLAQLKKKRYPSEVKSAIASYRGFSRFQFSAWDKLPKKKPTTAKKTTAKKTTPKPKATTTKKTKTPKKTAVVTHNKKKYDATGMTLGQIKKQNWPKAAKKKAATKRGYKKFNFD